jgi:hypothetical protein
MDTDAALSEMTDPLTPDGDAACSWSKCHGPGQRSRQLHDADCVGSCMPASGSGTSCWAHAATTTGAAEDISEHGILFGRSVNGHVWRSSTSARKRFSLSEVSVVGAELSDVIAKLREDLAVAMDAGEGERLRFELGPVEVTLSVSVTSTGAGKAGVRFWVVEAGVDGSLSHASGQQIKLTLNPKDVHAPAQQDGSYASPLVGGDAVSGEAG